MNLLKRTNGGSAGVPWRAWLALVIMVLLVCVALVLYSVFTDDGGEQRIEMTWNILKTEKLSFLTTQRQEWQANLDASRAAWYGIEETRGSILTDVFYGFDLTELKEEDVRLEEDGTVVIAFPKPKILTVSLRPETYGAVTKRTGLMVLKNMVEDRDDEVKQRLASLKRDVLLDMMRRQGLPLSELEEGIHDFLDPIFRKQGIPYRLEFPDIRSNGVILDYLKQEPGIG